MDSFKKHELFAVIAHFYNNKYVLDDLYVDFQKITLYFLKINPYLNTKNSDFQMIDDINVQSTVSNYNDLNCSFKFVYNFKEIKMQFFYDKELELTKASLYNHNRTKVYYNNEKQDLTIKFIKDQNRFITRFKFFDEYVDLISSKLNMHTIDINTVFRFRPYIKEILNFQKNRTYEPIHGLCRYSDELKRNEVYSLKNFIKIIKQNHRVLQLRFGGFCSRNIKLDYPEITNFHHIFIPVFEKMGGLVALENLVLRQRLIEE
jgi:hypothetical protein